jgi:hypothetical protein
VGNVQASGSIALKDDIAPLTYDGKSCLIPADAPRVRALCGQIVDNCFFMSQ